VAVSPEIDSLPYVFDLASNLTTPSYAKTISVPSLYSRCV
jgi:hypothetical protein